MQDKRSKNTNKIVMVEMVIIRSSRIQDK